MQTYFYVRPLATVLCVCTATSLPRLCYVNMPSKYRKTLSRRKERYTENSETLKRKAVDHYEANKDVVIKRAKYRMKTDETTRKKNAAQVKRRIVDYPIYAAENQKRAKLSLKQRLETNEVYRLANQTRAKANQKKRLQTNEAYRLAKQTKAKDSQKKRLENNQQYRKRNQKQAKVNKQRRLRTSEDYLQKQRAWNGNNM